MNQPQPTTAPNSPTDSTDGSTVVCNHKPTTNTGNGDHVCPQCVSEQLHVSLEDARTIAARIADPCTCGTPHDEICFNCIIDDPTTACDPRCTPAPVYSDHCNIHDFGQLTPDEFDALPDWPGRATTTLQPPDTNN